MIRLLPIKKKFQSIEKINQIDFGVLGILENKS